MHSQSLRGSLARAWGVATVGSRGPRPKLSSEAIAREAVAIADAEGIGAATLARVADACGVVTTALYRYVADKDDLVVLMTEHALAGPPSLDPARPDAAERWAVAFAERLRAHPWLASVQPRGVPLGPESLGWLDILVAALSVRGCADVAGVALQLSTTVRAYVAMEQSVAGEGPPDWWGSLVAERYPALARAFAGRDLSSPADDLDDAVARIL